MQKKCWKCLYNCNQTKELQLSKCRKEQLIKKVMK